MTAHPEHVARYLVNVAAPATTAAYEHLGALAAMPPMAPLARTVKACALVLERIDLAAIAGSLAEQRHIAFEGRPHGETGPRAKGGVSRPTESAGMEASRVIAVGMDLAEALDRIHPDPAWPTIASGRRVRTTTATELLAQACADAFGTLSPAQALDELADAVDGLRAAVTDATAKADAAARCRAWGRAGEVDPPDPVLEAMRCGAWWLGADRDGHPIRCQQWGSEHRTETGSKHPTDTCDDHFRELCPQCAERPRRTKGAKDCMTCEIRNRRQRAA